MKTLTQWLAEWRKPPRDVPLLLIGPAWTLVALFRALGIRY